MSAISILLVDDSPAFLTVATEFLDRCDGISVVGSALEPEEAMARAQDLCPDIVLIDFDMPDLSTSGVIPRLRAALPRVCIVAMTVPDISGYRRSSLAPGVDAFISRSTLRTNLIPTIWQVAEHRSHAAAAREAALHHRAGRVLVMEDEDDLRHFYSKALSRAGYRVLAAATIEQARGLLDAYHFDAFLCDIRMGAELGTDLLRERLGNLQEEGTQVIVVSAEPRYRDVCEELGADFFIVKPVSPGPLITLVNRLTAPREQVA